MREGAKVSRYLESVILAQREELRTLRDFQEHKMSELRKSLAASQADCADLRHQLSFYISLASKNIPATFNSTFASSSDESPRLSPHVSSPFARPHAPPPFANYDEDVLGLDEIS
jgi:hypothetical protein